MNINNLSENKLCITLHWQYGALDIFSAFVQESAFDSADEQGQAFVQIIDFCNFISSGTSNGATECPTSPMRSRWLQSGRFMHKVLLFVISALITATALGQTSRFLIDVKVGFLRYKEDSIEFAIPKTIRITTSSCTDIFSIGKSKMYEFGMRVEILQSKLTGKPGYAIGKAYYIKNNGQWEEILRFAHYEEAVKPIAERIKRKEEEYITGGASTLEPIDYEVRLNDDYYLNR